VEANEIKTIVTIMWSVLGALAVAGLGLLSWGVKKLIVASFENTLQIRILNEKIGEIIRGQLKIEKMEKDLNEAHSRIRELKHIKMGEN